MLVSVETTKDPATVKSSHLDAAVMLGVLHSHIPGLYNEFGISSDSILSTIAQYYSAMKNLYKINRDNPNMSPFLGILV